jgi:hypothetical protein
MPLEALKNEIFINIYKFLIWKYELKFMMKKKLVARFPNALFCKEKAKEKRTQLLTGERLLENLTFGLPFCHNFSFINSNWKSKTILNIYILGAFLWYDKCLIWTTFVCSCETFKNFFFSKKFSPEQFNFF